MEAMARGRPVVAPFLAGIPELVEAGRSGWLYPAGSAPHLAGALAELLDAPIERLAALGREGREKVRAQHGLEAIAAALRGLLLRS
jgi:glycosyltransferase involved in cell wall biosynthesis